MMGDVGRAVQGGGFADKTLHSRAIGERDVADGQRRGNLRGESAKGGGRKRPDLHLDAGGSPGSEDRRKPGERTRPGFGGDVRASA